jgi:hypothetical protein|tara:strand:+ start:824 stop:1372 length:549 start_codon:yes stop_codon:yes gene_type:complete
MIIKRTSPFYMAIAAYVLFVSTATATEPMKLACISQPPLANQLGWEITPAGLLVVSYDMNGNRKADYHTLRLVLKNYRSTTKVDEIKENYPSNTIFFINYGPDRHSYIVTRKPLFYGFDVNEDGHWDLLYKDILEDGVNGNEQFYESPSGLFEATSLNINNLCAASGIKFLGHASKNPGELK